jgi:hypothetical protein
LAKAKKTEKALSDANKEHIQWEHERIVWAPRGGGGE